MKKLLRKFGPKDSRGPPGSPSSVRGATGGGPIVGYDIREKELPKLHKATWNGDLSKVKQLIKKDVNGFDKENRTALHLACVRGHKDIVQLLLEWSAKSNVGDNQLRTPLIKAVECDQEECVKILLSYHADVDTPDREGDTGLHHAVRNGNAAIVHALIDGGANLNQKNKTGNAPLHLSVSGRSDEITRRLLVNKAEINITDANTRTALMYACSEGLINQVKLLLEYKPNTFLKDSKGWGAEDCAMMKGQHACSQLVFDYNLKLRKSISGPSSIISTPRSSLPPSNPTTPREKSDSNFGAPVGQADTDSENETLSKISAPGDKDNSWADDSEISQATDERKKHITFDDSDFDGDIDDEVAQPKLSLASKVNLDSDEDEESGDSAPGSRAGSANSKPIPRYKKQKIMINAESVRVINTRIPTPTGSNRSPNYTPSPKPTNNSKIPTRQLSGKSATSVEDNWSDTEPVDEADAQRKAVTFKSGSEISEIRDISGTEDDTDEAEDEEDEEIVKTKRRRVESQPHEAIPTPPVPLDAFTPSGTGQLKDTEKIKADGPDKDAMMDQLGLEDLEDLEASDSEMSSADPSLSPQEPIWKPSTTEAGTPRQSILKVKSDSVGKTTLKKQQAKESEDEESEWDSTKASERPESPEYDSELEGTLNPEHSKADDKTSQWSDTEENATPRTPRNAQTISDKELLDFEDDDDVEEIDQNIEEAVTSFKVTSPVGTLHQEESEEEEEDSKSEHHQQQQPPKPKSSPPPAPVNPPPSQGAQKEDGSDSEWDSEDEGGPSDPNNMAPVYGVEASPRVRSTSTEEEEESDWEIERKKEEEWFAKRKASQASIDVFVDDQAKWEKEEQEKREQLEREAAEELEREQEMLRRKGDSEEEDLEEQNYNQNADDGSSVDEASQASAKLNSIGSNSSQRSRELKKPPPKLVVTKFIASPRESTYAAVTTGEVENESPIPSGDLRRDEAHYQQASVISIVYGGDEDVEVEEEEERDFGSSNRNKTAGLPAFEREVRINSIEDVHKFDNFDDFDDFDEEKEEIQVNAVRENEEEEEEDMQENRMISRFADSRDEEDDDDIEAIVAPDTVVPVKTSWSAAPQDPSVPSVSSPRSVSPEQPVSFQQSASPQRSTSPPRSASQRSVIFQRTTSPQQSTSFQSNNSHGQDLPETTPTSQHASSSLTSDLRGIPATSLNTGVKGMPLRSDGGSMDDEDDSVDDLDSPRNRPDTTSYLPGLYGNSGLYNAGLDVGMDDDGLSVTSTENGDISSSYRAENLPYGRDILVNMNLNDSSAVLKLQEHLREHRRQLEHERSQKMLFENKNKLLVKEKTELQKKIDAASQQRSKLEQTRLDLEAKIRNLDYNLNEEEEKRKNAELLLNKTKEHLARKEEQFTSEMEMKQRAELTMRNIQMELRSAHNRIKEYEDEKDELVRALTNEKNARQLQEKINDEQQRLQHHVNEESVKTSSQRNDESEDAQNRLEMAGDDIDKAYENADKLRNEIIALKAELQRQRVRLTEENTMLTSENENLSSKVEDLKNEVKLQEEALTTASMQHNMLVSNLRSENVTISNMLESEKVVREKMEAELESLKTRLHSTTSQLDKSQMARNEFERRLHSDREEWAMHLERKDQELKAIKETTQMLLQKLNSTETKLNAVENELHVGNATILERSSQLQQTQRDLQYYKTSQDSNNHTLQHEKEQIAKLLGKVESLQDRLSTLQHENLTLKQKVDAANISLGDRSGHLQESLSSSVVAGLRSDHDKYRNSMDEKVSGLNDTIDRLRDDIRNSENKRSTLEQDLKKQTHELNDVTRKLSIAEAQLDIANKARDSLDQERSQMKLEMEKLQQRYHMAQEKTIEAQTRMGELVERLDRSEQNNLRSNQQLADTSANMNAYNTSKSELEDNYQKLQVEKVRIEAELKHEKQKSEMIQRDLQDSTKVRSSLEALCSNLKSTNGHLEEKLGPEHVGEVTAAGETMTRSLLAQEAEDSKGLWEQEVISRSKLGLRIAQLDRQRQESASHVEEEKRRTRKAMEQKRLAESKLDSEQQKSGQLQKEVANLKAYLKVAKKRLKDNDVDDAVDNNDHRFNTLNSAFNKERGAMDEMLISVKSQLEELKMQMQSEVDEKEKVQQRNSKLESEFSKIERTVKKLSGSKQKLEKEFTTYKNTVETNYTDKGTVEELKRDIETRYRQDLNRKLDEVNNYLEEQGRTRNRLDTSRDEQETRLRGEKKRLDDELTDIRIRYEQAQAQRETKELECKRYRDLYESEMQWRLRLSEQLYHSTDKAFTYKNNSERQRSRMYGSLNNLSVNGQTFDASRIASALNEDPLSNKLRAELDRSIAKHLEAAPHDQIRPIPRNDVPILAPSSFAQSNSDYIELLKRKYCV